MNFNLQKTKSALSQWWTDTTVHETSESVMKSWSPWNENQSKIMFCDSFIELGTLAAGSCVPPYMPKYAIMNIHTCIFYICYAYTYVYTYLFICIHLYTCAYTNTHLYIHTQIYVIAVYIHPRWQNGKHNDWSWRIIREELVVPWNSLKKN